MVIGSWKYIEPSKGPKINKDTNIELGNDPQPQLYNLADDPGERKNLAELHPGKAREMKLVLDKVKQKQVCIETVYFE